MKNKTLLLILILLFISTNAFSQISISGTISGAVQGGVSISLTKVNCGETLSDTETTLPDNGLFIFSNVETGDYLVTPERTGYTFSPKNRPVTISDSSVTGVDFTSAVARFVDNGDGTVTDTLTNLLWLKNANCVGTQDWNIASLFALGLGAYNGGCGLSDGSEYGDWRLPTKAELQGIGTDPLTTWYSDYPSATWTMPSDPFTNGGPGYFYWSSTENAANANYVWVLQMLSGYTNNAPKDGLFNVWPVRFHYTSCALGCPDNWIGDGECDYYCDVAACGYDNGDCGIPSCSQGCPDLWRGDGFCDYGCDVSACGYDNGDCGIASCSQGCPDNWPGDTYCDLACNVAACSYDNGDCGIASCDPGCPDSWIGDGYCDPACYVAACNYDDGDC